MNETFTVERLVGGAMKITSDSAWLPEGVMVIRPGEQYSLEIPGLGVTTVSTRRNHCYYVHNNLYRDLDMRDAMSGFRRQR